MKKSYIFGVLIIAVALIVIISTAGDASSYVSFGEAYTMASNGDSKMIHVVGQLKKDIQGKIVGVSTGQDKLSFTFIMVDQNQKEQKVYYNEPIPPDFLRSEQVVVVGSYQSDLFVADKILLKCPSKYVEEEVKVGA